MHMYVCLSSNIDVLNTDGLKRGKKSNFLLLVSLASLFCHDMDKKDFHRMFIANYVPQRFELKTEVTVAIPSTVQWQV